RAGQAHNQVFAPARSVADVIVAGAGTVAGEDYGQARLSPALRSARREQGRPEVPRIAVVTASLRIDPGRRLFAEAEPEARPLVLTTAAADADRRRALSAVAEGISVGEARGAWP